MGPERSRAHELANDHVIKTEEEYINDLTADLVTEQDPGYSEVLSKLIDREVDRIYFPEDSQINGYEDGGPSHGDIFPPIDRDS